VSRGNQAVGGGGSRETVDCSDLGVNDSSDCVGHLLVVEHITTRSDIGPGRETEVENRPYSMAQAHIAVSQLWKYSQEPIFLKIPPVDQNHLRECQDCVAVIWLCRSVSSIEAVEARLKKGISADAASSY
jgi:hypothetical protein